jgi:hypothetical protein
MIPTTAPRALFGVFCALLLLTTACGEDDAGPTVNAPGISALSIECGPFVGTGDDKVDGNILLRAEVNVGDADGDLAAVTLTFDGAIFAMTEGEPGTFSYDQGGSTNQIALCGGDETVVIRAIDALGNEAIFRGTSGE